MLGLGGSTSHSYTSNIYIFAEQSHSRFTVQKAHLYAVHALSYSPAGWGVRSHAIVKAKSVVSASSKIWNEVLGVYK